MFRALCYLALAALPVQCQVGSVALYYEFQQSAPKVLIDSVKQESNLLMAPAGVHFQWRELPSNGEEPTTEVAIVRFLGHCDSASVLHATYNGNRLGWSVVTNGEVIPFARIDCDNIIGFLQKRLLNVTVKDRDAKIGRAVARVLVHELDHIFGETTRHGSRDVDQPTYTADELLADHLNAPMGPHVLLPASSPVKAQNLGSAIIGKSVFQKSGCSACHGQNAEGTKAGPVLRAAGHFFNTVTLAVRLSRAADRMSVKAKNLKIPPPTLSEEQIQDLVVYLNAQQH